MEYSDNLFMSNSTFNSFLCPPRNVISETPSIRDNFSTISYSTKSPKLPKSSIFDPGNLVIANLEIGLSSEFDVRTVGRFASKGKPSIEETLLKSCTRAISIS